MENDLEEIKLDLEYYMTEAMNSGQTVNAEKLCAALSLIDDVISRMHSERSFFVGAYYA